MPVAVYVMALGIFAMVTSEFLVAGLMPQISESLDVSIPQVGYLITAFAIAMAAGGPFLAAVVSKLRPKSALMALFAIFLAGNALAGFASDYTIMLVARVVTGVASAAFFGVSLSLVARITAPDMRGRAIATAMNGLMVGTLLGLPLSTMVGGAWGWRSAFACVGFVTVVAALCTIALVPNVARAEEGGDMRQELAVFRKAKLWLVLSTSTLIIGATFAAFSYFTPILIEITGFSAEIVPYLLIAYGAATVIGNDVVGRLADRSAVRVLLAGLTLNTMFLVAFALLADMKVPAVIAMIGIGFVGVTMNPAMITRVQRTANARPLVNSVHSSFITLGVVIGSWLGGLGIDAFGLRAPLWLGAGLAVLGLVTLFPEIVGRGRIADDHSAAKRKPGAGTRETETMRPCPDTAL